MCLSTCLQSSSSQCTFTAPFNVEVNAGSCDSTPTATHFLFLNHCFALGLSTSSTLLALPRLDFVLSSFALNRGTSTTLLALPCLDICLLSERAALFPEPFKLLGNNLTFVFLGVLVASSHRSSFTPPSTPSTTCVVLDTSALLAASCMPDAPSLCTSELCPLLELEAPAVRWAQPALMWGDPSADPNDWGDMTSASSFPPVAVVSTSGKNTASCNMQAPCLLHVPSDKFSTPDSCT